ARELRRVMPETVRHPHALERLEHALLALLLVESGPVRQRQLDVLEHREVADQIERLGDEADLAVANLRALRMVELLDRRAVQPVAAAARRIEQPEDRQKRGLAASRRAFDRHVVAFLDVEVHARERVRLDLVRIEDLRKILELDEGTARVHQHLRGPRLLCCSHHSAALLETCLGIQRTAPEVNRYESARTRRRRSYPTAPRGRPERG